jgi:predicted dehydrogenase
MSDLAAAVVGMGFIGPVHVEGLRRAGVNVVGVLGSTPEKSAVAAQRLGVARAYATFDELLGDQSVHVVHIATPNRFHFEQTSAALAAGKHVLCEKPLAMNSRESAELVRLARDSGRAAGVCYNVRFYPLCLEAAQRVRRGVVGELYHVAGSYVQDWLLEETDFNWRVLGSEGGALRAVADIGTHWLDLIQFIAGRQIDEVFADLKTVLPTRRRRAGNSDTFTGSASATREGLPVEISTEDYGCVMFRMGGARGVLWVSQITAGRKNCLRFELAGSRRSLAWNSERPNELWLGRRDGPNETLLRDPSLLSPTARDHADYPGGHNEGFPDTFKQLFRAFYDYIRAGDYSAPATFPTFADGHREILLCEAILKSHQQQRWFRPATSHQPLATSR